MIQKLGLLLCGVVAGISLVVACETSQTMGGTADMKSFSDLKVGAGTDALAAPTDCPKGWTVVLKTGITGNTPVTTLPGEEPFAVTSVSTTNHFLFVRSCIP
jgi:hypothetical protein